MSGRLWLENRNGVVQVGHSEISNSGRLVRITSTATGEWTAFQPETATAMLVGTGCTITNGAMKELMDGGCFVYWLSPGKGKLVAVAPASSTANMGMLGRQVSSVHNKAACKATTLRSLALRFGSEPPQTYTAEQLRGWEGNRVRKHYETTSERLGIEWRGRTTSGPSDYLNGMISSCNSVVYTACQTAIRGLHISPDLGFLHVGENSFVYDIADHFKAELSVERVLNHFATRDRTTALDSSFDFSGRALPEIIEGVYQGIYGVLDKVLADP